VGGAGVGGVIRARCLAGCNWGGDAAASRGILGFALRLNLFGLVSVLCGERVGACDVRVVMIRVLRSAAPQLAEGFFFRNFLNRFFGVGRVRVPRFVLGLGCGLGRIVESISRICSCLVQFCGGVG